MANFPAIYYLHSNDQPSVLFLGGSGAVRVEVLFFILAIFWTLFCSLSHIHADNLEITVSLFFIFSINRSKISTGTNCS